MMPTICDGKRLSRGKKKPVTLVNTVVARNTVVHTSFFFDPIISMTTTTPAAMATRLRMTWTNMKVETDIPRIMRLLLFERAEIVVAREEPHRLRRVLQSHFGVPPGNAQRVRLGAKIRQTRTPRQGPPR